MDQLIPSFSRIRWRWPNASSLPRMTCGTKSDPGGVMRPQRQYTLTAKDVQAHAIGLCQEHLRLRDHGPKCTAPVLYALLFWAAARMASLAAACKALRDAPCYQAAHDALLATLPDIHQLQRLLNPALQGDLPRALRRREQPVAIDLHL